MLPALTPFARRAVTALALLAALPQTVAAEELSDAELRALRYYVEQNDTRSARAELRRLQALHPDWTPPASVEELRTAPQTAARNPGQQTDAVWQQMEIGNFAAARQRLDALRAAYPDWTPPPEMTRQLTVGEAQTNFDRAVAAGDAQGAIDAARRAPTILRCDRVNNAWQLAVMQRKLGDDQGALGTYRGVIGSCTDADVTVATLEKADAVGSTADLRALADLARSRRPAIASRIDETEERLLRGRGAGTGETATAAAPAATRTAPTPAPAASAPSAPRSAGSLPATGDGRVAATRRAAQLGDWRGCLASSQSPRSVDLLYERAWCAYNQDRSLEALAAFRVASTAPLGATVQRDARFGMILSFLDNEMTEDAARLAAATPLTDEQRVQVETVILDQRGVRAYQTGQYADAIAYFDALEGLGGLRRDLAILRAYAHLNAGQRPVAKAQFQELHDQLATTETRRGLNAALR